MTVDFTQIRRLIVIAMFSDDELYERFVLKGGNALELVHGVILRGSLDIDLAMQDDFKDADDVRGRIFRALRDRFDAVGHLVFDESFSARPRVRGPHKPDTWGGYLVEFKLIARDRAVRLDFDQERMRREAHTLGTTQQRVFRIEISKYEFCAPKAEADIDAFTIYVYTLEMCVLEKLRAICQQMPQYPIMAGTRRARARDFYDIHAAVEGGRLDLAQPKNLDLCRNIFAAKDVPLSLLAKIPDTTTREFHRPDWDQVRISVPQEIEGFDYYFDYVARVIIPRLEPLWVE